MNMRPSLDFARDILRAIRDIGGPQYWRLRSLGRWPRLGLNWLWRDRPRVCFLVDIRGRFYPLFPFHPGFREYVYHPPVHYTLYSLADICHFWHSVPPWNKKPYVVHFEHVLSLAGDITDWQHGLQRTRYVEDTIASDRCRVALALSKGVIKHSLHYISDPALHRKFDYVYACYPSQPDRVMDLSGPFTILTIGNQFYGKGIPAALEAFRILRQRYATKVRMWLVCSEVPSGYPIPEGVTVHRDFRLSNAKKAMLYGQSHVFFLPVLNDSFSCYVEAYAYGTPVVTTRIHHGDEPVRAGVTGFMVDPPFYAYSDDYGTRWKGWGEFLVYCRESYEQGAFDTMIEQCVDCLDRMVRGDIDLPQMSRSAQTFHKEVFSLEARNEKLRQVYQRVAGL